MTVFESPRKCTNFTLSMVTLFILQAMATVCNSNLSTVSDFFLSWGFMGFTDSKRASGIVSFGVSELPYRTMSKFRWISKYTYSSASVLLFNLYHRGIWIAYQDCNFSIHDKSLCFKSLSISLLYPIFILKDFPLTISVPGWSMLIFPNNQILSLCNLRFLV